MSSIANESTSMPGVKLAQEPLGISGALVVVTGELDVAAAPQLRELLNGAVDRGASPLVVDLAGVWFIDSLSLATVVRAQTRLGDRGRMALVTEHPYVLLVISAAGLDSVIDVFPTREAALAALGEGPGATG